MRSRTWTRRECRQKSARHRNDEGDVGVQPNVSRLARRENRFEAPEFAAELARRGLHGSGQIERHLGGMVFVGTARKS